MIPFYLEMQHHVKFPYKITIMSSRCIWSPSTNMINWTHFINNIMQLQIAMLMIFKTLKHAARMPSFCAACVAKKDFIHPYLTSFGYPMVSCINIRRWPGNDIRQVYKGGFQLFAQFLHLFTIITCILMMTKDKFGAVWRNGVTIHKLGWNIT